jgi:hypothetical protein
VLVDCLSLLLLFGVVLPPLLHCDCCQLWLGLFWGVFAVIENDWMIAWCPLVAVGVTERCQICAAPAWIDAGTRDEQ